MSHTSYPNAYAPSPTQFSHFQQPQHAGPYTPNTNSNTYPNTYADIYQQRPPSAWNAQQVSQQRPVTPQPPRPPSAQPQQVEYAPGSYSPIRAQSPLHPQPGQQFDPTQRPNLGYPQYHVSRPAPPARADSVFSQHTQQQGRFSTPPGPIQQSPPRRPLPTPQARPVTNPIPDRRPLPDTQQPSPSAPSTPFHRTSYSTSATPTSSGFSTRSTDSSNASNTGSQFSTRSSRPLPTPIPRSTKSVDLSRSSSPVKDILNTTGPLPPPGQKFVPLWKRNLPSAPAQSPEQSTSAAGGRPSVFTGPSGGSSDHGGPRNGGGIRPLPPSPVQSQMSQQSPRRPTISRDSMDDSRASSSPPKMPSNILAREQPRVLPGAPNFPNGVPTRRATTDIPPAPSFSNAQPFRRPTLAESPRDSPVSSGSEDMYENSLLKRPPQSSMIRPPSPSGVRDAPTRSSFERPQKPAEPGQAPGAVRSGRRMSIVSRMAEMSMNGSSTDLSLGKTHTSPGSSPPKREHAMPVMDRVSTQSSSSRWPSDLPPLPRTPQMSSEPGEQRSPPKQPFASHSQQYQQAPPQPSPTRSQFPTASQRETSPTRGHLPQLPSQASPTRSRFTTQSRDTSPTRGAPQAPLSSLPQTPSNPSSPTRPRFPPQAPARDPALPAPKAQRMIPNLDDAPPPSLRRSPSPVRPPTYGSSGGTNGLPSIRTQGVGSSSNMMSPPSGVTPTSATSAFSLSAFPAPPQTSSQQWNGQSGRSASPSRKSVPRISFDAYQAAERNAGPSISVSGPDQPHTNGLPKISFPGMDDDDDTMQIPSISVGGPDERLPQIAVSSDDGGRRIQNPAHPLPTVKNKGGLFCGGCGSAIFGRSVHTQGANWHPGCFRCAACEQLLENLAMFEHENRNYCSLCYYENFAPRCYHCQTAIADQDFITLSEADGLGKRTYHTQHFFCAECGDPFLPPSGTARNFSGDGTFDAGAGAGFTVHNGHPYCEHCHVRLRMPKCKKCKKSIRNDMDALEVLGGKWCPECFVCKACDGPFTNGRFFLRDEKPFCQRCFEIIIKSEL